jgi:hypothetical protein
VAAFSGGFLRSERLTSALLIDEESQREVSISRQIHIVALTYSCLA